MNDLLNFKDRIVLITGGASGIGRACVEVLARAGANVAVADIDGPGAEIVAAAARANGGKAQAFQLDVRDYEATEATVGEVDDALGAIDGPIAAAGVAKAMPASMMRAEHWEPIIAVNLTGLLYTVQIVGRRMVDRRKGSIVTLGSTSSIGGQAGRAAYCASKAGVVGLTEDLAIEWGPFGVRVNAVGPSVTDTAMVRNGLPEQFLDEVVTDRTPLGRIGQPAEIANVCMFLLSDLSGYMTGSLLMVDGGVSAGFFTHHNGRDFSSRALLNSGIYEE